MILTNPDMLHTGILPHHTKWMRLFENLRYIVLDELHTYRGVFGSHLANVLRRLARIARFYGSEPQFICCSATIANPGELASQLIESEVETIEENGAPAAEKLFVFYNPPMVNRNLGIRRSYLNETTRVAKELLARKLQTIVFANSRLHTEVLLTYLQQANPPQPGQPEPIRGYRGGYLPGERREIERGLREGRIRGVVATNALELGIDIGSLDASVMAGYAGSIASTWQRAGRAGRRSGTSCAVLVASSAPLDQFIVQHPDYFFGRSPEHAYVQPDNLEILVNHLKCAAFELPLSPDEQFGEVDLPALCERLAEAGFLHRSGGNWHWVQEAYPADTVSLRSVTSDNFVIIDTSGDADGASANGKPEVIGEVDFSSALTTVHPKAIYLHQGQQYHVERLDFDQRKAYVKPVNVDYYTDAIRYTQVRVLEIAEEERIAGPAARAHGDVLVRSQVVGFKKIKFFTNENVGDGKLELPENEMHTTAFWITLERPLLAGLPFALSERQSGIFGLLYALESMASLLLMCDRRDLGTAVGRTAASPGVETEWQEFIDGDERSVEDEGIFRAESVSLRRVSGRHWIQRAALSRPRFAAAADARIDRGVPLRERMPFMRRPGGRKERAHEGSGARDSGASLRMSATTPDPFARLAGVETGAPTLRRRRTRICDAARHLARCSARLGAARGDSGRIGTTQSLRRISRAAAVVFGIHRRRATRRRNWMPGRCGCSLPDAPEEIADPRQWLFLDTETTGPRRRHGHVSVSGGHRVVGCGRTRSRAVFHARAQRGAFGAGGAGGAAGGAPSARHIQREIVRLAAARNALSHDAHDPRAQAARASRFPASGAKSVAAAAWYRCGCRNSKSTCWDGTGART